MNKKPYLFIFLFSIFLAVAFISCDETTSPADPNFNISGVGFGDNATGLTMRAEIIPLSGPGPVVLGECPITPVNNFNLSLNVPPSSLLIRSQQYNQFLYNGSLTVSDTSAKVTTNLGLYYYQSGNQVGYAYRNNYHVIPTGPGAGLASYMYSDKPVTFSGEVGFLTDDSLTVNVNLTLAAGWNIVSDIITEKRPGYEKRELRNGDVSNARWDFTRVR